MADDGDDDDPTWEHAKADGLEGPVAAALLEQWQVGDDATVYRILAVEVAPRLISHLRTAFRLQDADRQDCLSAAHDRFQPAVRSRKILANPSAYFFKIGINAALELLRESKAELLHPSVDVEAACAGDDADVFGASTMELALPTRQCGLSWSSSRTPFPNWRSRSSGRSRSSASPWSGSRRA